MVNDLTVFRINCDVIRKTLSKNQKKVDKKLIKIVTHYAHINKENNIYKDKGSKCTHIILCFLKRMIILGPKCVFLVKTQC